MPERTSGLRAVLSGARGYLLWQRLSGWHASQPRFIAEHLYPRPGDRVLDLGCGPAELFEVLPRVDYVGIDLSEQYVDAARRRYGDRAQFWCVDAAEGRFPSSEPFDLAVSAGLLHHLSDAQVARLLAQTSKLLRHDGRLVTIDPALEPAQPRLARWLIASDRGQNVRTAAEYRELASRSFADVRAIVRSDLLRFPYTHAILECRGPR